MGDPCAPSDDWRKGWIAGYESGLKEGQDEGFHVRTIKGRPLPKKKRKPTAYNNFVAKKSQLSKFKYKSSRGKKKKGMTNLKAIGIAWRKLSKAQQNKYK